MENKLENEIPIKAIIDGKEKSFVILCNDSEFYMFQRFNNEQREHLISMLLHGEI